MMDMCVDVCDHIFGCVCTCVLTLITGRQRDEG